MVKNTRPPQNNPAFRRTAGVVPGDWKKGVMSHGATSSERPTLRDLARACRALTPVVVDIGPGQPKLASYMNAVHGRGAAAWLHLGPIAADAIPERIGPRGVVIRSTDPDVPFVVAARRMDAVGSDAARVPLEAARFERMPSRAARSEGRGREPMVLLIPGTDGDVEAHIYPILDLGSDFCSIEATIPLEPGRAFDQVEILGDRRRLRRASMRVLEAIPWRTPLGDRRFRCRLALGDELVSEGSGRSYDVISEPQALRRTLQITGMLEAAAWYEDGLGWGRGHLRLKEVGESSIVFALEPPLPETTQLPSRLQVGFELFDVSYEMTVRLMHRRAGRIEVSLPLSIRRRRRRSERRVQVPERTRVEIAFRNPAIGRMEVRAVRDLSFRGICFEMDRDRDVLWNELPLEGAELRWAGGVAHVGELEVRGTEEGTRGDARCHAMIRNTRTLEDLGFIDLLAHIGHPEAEVHDGSDFRGVLDVWMRGGLFAPHMQRNFEPLAPRISSVWRRLHESATDVARTLVHRTDGALDGTVSALRAWERTWIGQHFAAVSSKAGQVTGKLHFAYVDHVLLRPDAHYMLFFVKADNDRMNAFYHRFFDLTGTPEAVERSTVELWSRSADHAPPVAQSSSFRVRKIRASDETLIARAAAAVFGPLSAAALSFGAGELSLPDTSVRFRKAGLQRERRLRLVTCKRGPVWAVVEELASPGLNLTWMLNAAWVIPIHPELDPTREGLELGLRDFVDGPAPETPRDRFLLVPAGLSPEPLHSSGFEMEADAHMYAMNRAGLHRYHQYVADRYGEVDALFARRERMRAGRARTADGLTAEAG